MTDGFDEDADYARPRSWLVSPVVYAADERRQREQAKLQRQAPAENDSLSAVTETTVGQRHLPSVVVVPAHPVPADRVGIELATLLSGVEVAIIFSNVAKLVDRLGKAQPWIMLPSAQLVRQLGSQATTIVLDPGPGVVRPRWSPSRVKLFTEVIDGLV